MAVPNSVQNFSKIFRPSERPLDLLEVFRFDSFTLIERERVLLCEEQPVALKAKDFDVLLVLVKRRPQLVTKAQLLEAVWPNAFVGEANLGVHIAALRKALRRHSSEQLYIQTVHKHGYRFVGDVRLTEQPELSSSSEPDVGRQGIGCSMTRPTGCGNTTITLPRGVRIEACECSLGSKVTIAVPDNPRLSKIGEFRTNTAISDDISLSGFDRDGVRYITVFLTECFDSV